MQMLMQYLFCFVRRIPLCSSCVPTAAVPMNLKVLSLTMLSFTHEIFAAPPRVERSVRKPLLAMTSRRTGEPPQSNRVKQGC